MGDQVGSFVTVRSIIDSDRNPISDKERAEALRFYEGEDQWDGQVKAERLIRHRPTLTINRLPELIAAAISNDPHYNRRLPGATLSVSQAQELEDAKVLLVRRNREAQMIYNYMASTQVEFTAVSRTQHAAPSVPHHETSA